MKALLHYQTVLLLRKAVSIQGATFVLGMGLLFALLLLFDSHDGIYEATLVLAMLPIGLTAMALMVDSLNGVDVVRWTLPVSALRVFASYYLFWTLVLAPPAACVALRFEGDTAQVLARFGSLLLMFAVAASAALVLQRQMRRRSLGGVLVTFALAFCVLSLAFSGVVATWMGNWAPGLGGLLLGTAVVLVLCGWSFVREEGLPAPAGLPDSRLPQPSLAGSSARKTRAPWATILRGTWPLGFTCMYVAMGLMYQVFRFAPDNFAYMFIPIAAGNLGALALSHCGWLMASPLDRTRAFRLIYLPILVFAAALAAMRYAVVDLAPYRTEILHDFRKDQDGRTRGHLAVGDLLRVDPVTRVCSPPEPAFMAHRVRDYLRSQFGLDLQESRILATILRGWPDLGPGYQKQQDALLDAMNRVQADLEPEIRAADRLRRAVSAAMALLITMISLRFLLTGGRWVRFVHVVVMIPTLFLAFPLDFETQPGTLLSLLLGPRALLDAAFQQSSAPVSALLFLIVGGLVVFLWRSGSRAFRRLDLADLPPVANNKGFWGQT